jgi:predicted enzyme related to lactoylglutathione lyase/quinol monooxygenase YgiN
LAAEPVSLISEWFVRPDRWDDAMAATAALAGAVRAGERDTLTYLVHIPFTRDPRLQALPPARPFSILFFETYRSADAFLAHLDGPVFTAFVAQHGDLFVAANGKPFTSVAFLSRHAGFVRSENAAAAAADVPAENRHPAVMFEIIANDAARMAGFYTSVFGWSYEVGTGNFRYIHFPAGTPPLLGGIGQAEPDTPGFAPGHNFYLQVEAIEPVLDRAYAAGAQPLMPPTAIDGYRFAMFTDPEGNPIGLIEPFGA